MGYLFVAIALFAGCTKGYCGKKTSGLTSGYMDASFVNLIRMIFCILIGAAVTAADGSLFSVKATASLMLVTACSGVATSLFVITWLVSVKKGAYTMIDVFLMLGTLIPILLGSALFGEEIKLKTVVGFVVLIAAVSIMCSYNNSIKEKMTISSFLLLLAAGISNGIADFSQKLFVRKMPDVSVGIFNFYTYVFSAITLLIFLIAFSVKYKEKSSSAAKNKSIYIYILVMSICLFVNSYFKTAAAKYLDSAMLYPLNQGLSLVLSLFMSAVFFDEKFTSKAAIGALFAFVGLVIINVI